MRFMLYENYINRTNEINKTHDVRVQKVFRKIISFSRYASLRFIINAIRVSHAIYTYMRTCILLWDLLTTRTTAKWMFVYFSFWFIPREVNLMNYDDTFYHKNDMIILVFAWWCAHAHSYIILLLNFKSHCTHYYRYNIMYVHKS